MHARNYQMLVPGCDIVDLRAANAPSARRFYASFAERVCTPREQEWVDAYAGDCERRRHRALWSLWAAKEAVFKARCSQAVLQAISQESRGSCASGPRRVSGRPEIRRRRDPIDFVPRRIEILADARLATARVSEFPGRSGSSEFASSNCELAVHYRHGAEWVLALCHSMNASVPQAWIGRQKFFTNSSSMRESTAVREMLLAAVARLAPSSLRPSALSIHGGRASGLAPWLRYRRRRRIPISLSHDGDWLAGALPAGWRDILFAREQTFEPTNPGGLQ